MSAAPTSSNRARDGLARWERDGEIVGYVSAATMCWFPRRPQFMRARREGFETILRCGRCPGCREFERLILERRLVKTYRAIAKLSAAPSSSARPLGENRHGAESPQFFAVRVYCPREQHASTMRGIHRARGVDVAFGFVRAGVESLRVVTRSLDALSEWLLRRRLRFDFRPMSRLDRRRSWRWFTDGMIVARSAYGENINRWYCRGLAPRDKEKWEVENLGEYKPFDRAEGPRVKAEKLGSLMPPALWKLPRGVSVRIRNLERTALSPERVYQVMPELRRMVESIGRRLDVSAVPTSPEQIERNRRAYQLVAHAGSEALVNAKPSDISSPPLVRGVTELLDNSGSFEERTRRRAEAMMRAPPEEPAILRAEAEAAEASEKHRSEILARRSRKQLDDAFERLRKLAEKLREEDKP